MKICPNLNDRQTRVEFEHLVLALGEEQAYETWSNNGGQAIDKAANGKESILYHQLFKYVGSHEQAIKIKATALNTERFGKDVNGEPKFVEVLKAYNIVSKKVGIREEAVSSRMAQQFIKHLNTIFPELTIVEETNETTKEIHGNEKIKAWVEEGVVHFNINQVTTDTFIHELGHIVEPILKSKYADKYAHLETFAVEVMNNPNHQLYPLYVNIKGSREENGLSTDKETMKSEMIANMIGFTSERKILDKLSKLNNIGQVDSFSIFNKIKGIFTSINEALSDFFKMSDFDSGSTTVNDILVTIVNDILSGKVSNLSLDEKIDLMQNVKEPNSGPTSDIERTMNEIFGKTISDKLIALNGGNTLEKNKDGSLNAEFAKILQEQGLNAALKSIINTPNVNYQLKSVSILLSDKAKQVFDKGNKNRWSLDKILTELAIPKEQKQLLLDLGITDREQLALELASKYSYSVEINTANNQPNKFRTIFALNGNIYNTHAEDFFRNEEEIDQQEYNDALYKYNKLGENNTQYYSNLTVPGGTNYTENEISTPLITPSIKGHAQFATDNGIGWFRSDDAEINPSIAPLYKEWKQAVDNDVSDEVLTEINERFNAAKGNGKLNNTRRILEVQSDLFQKWRNNFEFENNKYTAKKDDKNVWHYYKNGTEINANEYTKTWETFLDTYLDNADAFTKLLQKDNNWVTFFIKSIIQDSAKKGYEKVLFPKGETAAKIEGHETIAEQLKRIDEAKENPNKYKSFVAGSPGYRFYDNTLQVDITALDVETFNEKLDIQKTNLKSQGIEKLKPIEAFYEIKVGNILEKQFGKENVKTITDEYGNEWREIEIKPKRDLFTIQFSTGNVKVNNAIGEIPTEEEMNDTLRDTAASDLEYDENDYQSKYQEKYREKKPYKAPKENKYSGIKVELLTAAESNAKTKITGISSLNELNKALMGDKYGEDDIDLLTEDMLNRMHVNSLDKDNYEVWYGGEQYVYSKTTSFEELRRDIKRDISGPMLDAKHNLKNNIISKYKFDKEKSIEENLELVFGDNMAKDEIRKFMRLSGLVDNVQYMLKYSDLKNMSNPELNKLYDERLVGHDPLILIHGMNSATGEIDMSIVDVSSGFSTAQSYVGESKYIMKNYQKDGEYYNRGGRLTASDTDVRTMNIGVNLLHFNKVSDNKIRYRNIGVIHINKGQVTPRLVLGTEQLMENLAIIGSNEDLKKDFKDDYVLSLMQDEKLLKSNYNQSFISRLKSMLVHNIETSTDSMLVSASKKQLAVFLDPEATNDDILNMIEAMKEYRVKNLKGIPRHDDEVYRLLVGASREKRTGNVGFRNSLKDISKLEKYVTTALGQKNELNQDVVNVVKSITYNVTEIVSKRQNALKNLKTKSEKSLLNTVMGEHINLQNKVAAYVFANRGSKYFGHMYKTAKVNTEKGIVEAPLPKLHNSLSDVDTKALYDQGIITQNDLDLANYILDEQQEYWIKIIQHIETQRAKKGFVGKVSEVLMREKAEEIYFRSFSRGDIVMIPKGSGEMIGDLNVKGAIEKGIMEATNSENFFSEIDNGGINEVYSFFYSQKNVDNRLAQCGLKINNGHIEFTQNGQRVSKQVSLNLFHTHFSFILSNERKIQFDNELMPLYEDAITLHKTLELFKGDGTQNTKNSNNGLQWLISYVERIANGKNEDEQVVNGKINTPVGEISLGAATRMLSTTMRSSLIAWRPIIGVWSFVYNTNRLLTESLAASLAGADRVVPTFGNMTKAMGIVGFGNKYKLIQQIALKNHVYNRTERDLLQNPFIDPTQKFLFQDQYSNLFNWATDTASRSVVMVAQMIQDGSFDAYSYNKKTHELEYDEKKDGRFYSKGVKRNDGESIAEYNRVRGELIRSGQMQESDKELTTGYDRIAAENFKYIADKYIIGSMDDTSRNLMTNNFLGQLVATFKLFSFERLQNAGLFGQKRITSVGQKTKAIQLDNGEWISVKEAIEYEGMFQSLVATAKSIKQFGLMSPTEFKKWFDNQSDIRRYNLTKSMIQGMMISLLWGIGQSFDDDDKEQQDMSRTWAKLLSDMTVFSVAGDFVTNPIPLVNWLTNVFGKAEYYKLLPASSFVTDVDKMFSDEEEK